MKFKQFLTSKGLDESSFAEKEAKEQGVLISEFNDANFKSLEKAIEDAEKASTSKEEIEAIKENFEQSIADANSTFTEKLRAQGVEIGELKNRINADADKSKSSLLKEVEKNAEQIKASTQKGKDHTFVIKADTLRSSVVGNPNAFDLTTIGQLAHRKLTVYDAFRKVPVPDNSNGVVRYVDWNPATTERAAAARAEGAVFPESTARWATYTLNLEKVGDMIPMSEEFMKDSALFAAELDNFLRTNVAIKIDTDLVDGDGATPNINGLKNQIPNYTPVAAGIADASIYDLIVKLREAITAPYGSKYSPNVAFMNIADINKMKLKKDLNNNYVLPPFFNQNGQAVDGITVIECNAFTANTMVIGDSRYGAIYEIPELEVTTGYATGDFESDMMTLKAKKRMNLLIRQVDRTGWLEVTSISAALTTLAT
jgi:hypothetical protein